MMECHPENPLVGLLLLTGRAFEVEQWFVMFASASSHEVSRSRQELPARLAIPNLRLV